MPLSEALARATSSADAARIETEWDSLNELITFDQGTYFSASFVRHIEHSAQPSNESYCLAVVRTHAACSSSTRRQ